MSLVSKKYQISVCVPVFGTEAVLLDCLKSISSQTILDKYKNAVEIVVVDDCSISSTENSAKKIVKQFVKANNIIPVNFLRHEKNKGLVEARRTAIYAAKGKYIFNLDSDDTLTPDALLKLYEKAEASGADIVQGKASVVFGKKINKAIDSNDEILERNRKEKEENVNRIFDGELNNLSGKKDILDGFLIKKNHVGFLWGKLFLKETYLEAFNHIPPLECTMCEDLIQYIWLCYEAKKYVSISDIVYNYSINTGISSRSVIDNLERWEKVCSTAGVFTALYSEFDNQNVYFSNEEKDAIRKLCLYYLKNNLVQWKQTVLPELKADAYKMLCDYWGEGFVEKVQKATS